MPQPATYNILLLDDDPVLLTLATAFLSMAGHQTTATGSSDEALAALKTASPFDLVLTDLHMPGLEDHALAHALRQAIPPGTALVGMSATEPSPETLALLDAFLLKPFDQQALLHVIAGAVQNRAASDAATQDDASNKNASEPVLDETILNSLAGTIPSPQLRRLYDMGIADIEKRLARIHEAITVDDLASVKREAHAIKGSCGMVGARELQALAAAIEDGTTLDTAAIAEIPRACRRLQHMLDDKLQLE